jgi:hypothetical protein
VDPSDNQDQTTKQCPFCAETILAAAVKCRYCRSDLTQAPPAPPRVDSNAFSVSDEAFFTPHAAASSSRSHDPGHFDRTGLAHEGKATMSTKKLVAGIVGGGLLLLLIVSTFNYLRCRQKCDDDCRAEYASSLCKVLGVPSDQCVTTATCKLSCRCSFP